MWKMDTDSKVVCAVYNICVVDEFHDLQVVVEQTSCSTMISMATNCNISTLLQYTQTDHRERESIPLSAPCLTRMLLYNTKYIH